MKIQNAWGALQEDGKKLKRAVGNAIDDAEKKILTHAVKGHTEDEKYDGMLVGRGGAVSPRGTKLSDIQPYVPSNGQPPHGLIVHVNGINNDLAFQSQSLQKLADDSGAAVIGIHNSTQGVLADVIQAKNEKFDDKYDAPVRTLEHVINDAVKDGKPLHLSGHSQGALIISRALRNYRELLEKGLKLPPAEVEKRMGLITVETFGGAAKHYPDGPHYTHYVNIVDQVPMLTGLGGIGAYPGKDAVVHRFTHASGDLERDHSFQNVYLPQRMKNPPEVKE